MTSSQWLKNLFFGSLGQKECHAWSLNPNPQAQAELCIRARIASILQLFGLNPQTTIYSMDFKTENPVSLTGS